MSEEDIYGTPQAADAMRAIALARQAPAPAATTTETDTTEAAPPGATPPQGAKPTDVPKPPEVPVPPAITAPAAAAPVRGPEELEALISKHRRSPEQIAADVRRHLGEPPAQPGRFEMQPGELALMLLPLLFGRGQATQAMFRGALSGHAARQAQAREQAEAYLKRAGEMGARMEEQDWRHIGTLAPYYAQRVSDRERIALQRADQDLRRQKLVFDQKMAAARLAFQEFQWANPSATAQLNARLRTAGQRIQAAHNQAQEALGQGRLDEAKRHNLEAEAGMWEARAIAREQVQVARGRLEVAIQRAAKGGATDNQTANRIRSYYQFLERMANSTEDDLASDLGLDPARAARLNDDLRYYETEIQRLRPVIARMTGNDETATQPGPKSTAPGPGKTLTRAQIRAYAQQYGVSEAEAERQAKAKGHTIAP